MISVGLYGHSGDSEVREGMSEDTRTKTKIMLDDMHKRKIDMADEIFVINVGGLYRFQHPVGDRVCPCHRQACAVFGGTMIRRAGMKDLHILVELACKLWPDNTVEELCSEIGEIIVKPDAAFFLAYVEDASVGFAQCQLRHDYVEGTDSSPVGYLEGIYVADGYRKQGIAKELLAACESWSKSKGCSEFASDCELDNVQSLQFHLNVGFEEANRIICFTKKL